MSVERQQPGSGNQLLVAFVLTALLAVSCVVQFNQYPLERFPNWDAFWVDTQTVGYLGALRDALLQGTIPTIGPYTNFGWNAAGDTTLIASAFNPIHWLVLIMDPVHVIVFRTVAYFAIGAFGVYLFFLRVVGSPRAGLMAGFAYVALPMNYTLLYHSNMIGFVYFVPILLVAIHAIIARRGRHRWLWFALWGGLSTASSDVYGLIALPVVIGAYSFVNLLPNARVNPYRTVLLPATLILVWLAVSSFYVVPFAYNILLNGNFARSSGILSEETLLGAQGFLHFLQEYVLWDAFIKPIDTVSIILYVPVSFYVVIAATLSIGPFVFDREGKSRLVLVLSILLIAVLLFAESFVFYSIPALAASSTGLLRVQIKLYSFLISIAAFICLADCIRYVLSRSSRASDLLVNPRLGLLLGIGLVSFLIDRKIFGGLAAVPGPDVFAINHTPRTFPSSNLVPLPFGDVWPLLVPVNLAFFVCSCAAIMFGSKPWQTWRLPQYVAIAGAFASCVLTVSVHNDARLQQSLWALETNSDYRFATYTERAACVDGLTGPRDDPEFRTLYAGKDIYGSHYGRNWKAIAETELNVIRHEKVLFPYRNTIHPYVAAVRSAFGDSTRLNNLWPVTASSMPAALDLARFIGVRWIVSNDEPIDISAVPAGTLIELGSCSSPDPELYTNEPFQGGVAYVYEIPAATGVAFALPGTTEVGAPAKDGPRIGSELLAQANLEGDATRVISDGYRGFSVRAQVEESSSRLVISVIHRPGWVAELNGSPINVGVAFGGFMTLDLPTGTNEVRFYYRPYEVWIGSALCAIALLLSAVAGLVMRKPEAQ